MPTGHADSARGGRHEWTLHPGPDHPVLPPGLVPPRVTRTLSRDNAAWLKTHTQCQDCQAESEKTSDTTTQDRHCRVPQRASEHSRRQAAWKTTAPSPPTSTGGLRRPRRRPPRRRAHRRPLRPPRRPADAAPAHAEHDPRARAPGSVDRRDPRPRRPCAWTQGELGAPAPARSARPAPTRDRPDAPGRPAPRSAAPASARPGRRACGVSPPRSTLSLAAMISTPDAAQVGVQVAGRHEDRLVRAAAGRG